MHFGSTHRISSFSQGASVFYLSSETKFVFHQCCVLFGSGLIVSGFAEVDLVSKILPSQFRCDGPAVYSQEGSHEFTKREFAMIQQGMPKEV